MYAAYVPSYKSNPELFAVPTTVTNANTPPATTTADSANSDATTTAATTTATTTAASATAATTTTAPPEQTYRRINELLQQSLGRAELGDDSSKLEAINEFLKAYPYNDRNKNKKNNNKSGEDAYDVSWVNITVKELFINAIQTAIDIINDLSQILSERNLISSADFRRAIFEVFTRKSRRTYVGLWLIFLSFILYFIDSAT